MKRNLIISLWLILISTTVDAQNICKTTNPDTMSIKSSSLACSLTDKGLLERKAVLQKEIFSNVKKIEEVDTGYLFYFEDVDDLLPSLFQYVLAETECCPFFEQEVLIGADNSGITWKLSGPEGVKEIVSYLVEKIESSEH